MSATAGRRAHGQEIQESARLQTQRNGRIEGGTAHGKEKQESACPDTQRSREFEGARKFLGHKMRRSGGRKFEPFANHGDHKCIM